MNGKKAPPWDFSQDGAFLFGSERTFHGETAAEEVCVRPIPVWQCATKKIFSALLRMNSNSRSFLVGTYIVEKCDQFIHQFNPHTF